MRNELTRAQAIFILLLSMDAFMFDPYGDKRSELASMYNVIRKDISTFENLDLLRKIGVSSEEVNDVMKEMKGKLFNEQ